jgi:hypothetical protein
MCYDVHGEDTMDITLYLCTIMLLYIFHGLYNQSMHFIMDGGFAKWMMVNEK